MLSVNSMLPLYRHIRVMRIRGDSMAPTLLDGQYVLTVPIGETDPAKVPARRELLAFRDPELGKELRVKRVVGLPDEHIAIREGRVEIDGDPVAEPYLEPSVQTFPKGASQWFSGPEDCFLLGDNRGPSRDSRAYGPVPRHMVVGRVWFRCWPPKLL